MSAPLRCLLLLVGVLAFWPAPAAAHELRPAYLEITGKGGDTYAIRFKVPARGPLRLGLDPRLPDRCTHSAPPRRERAATAFVDRLVVTCPGGLTGGTIAIDGLAATLTDVIARVSLAGENVQTVRLTPDRPQFAVTGSPSWGETARTYFLLGVEHILFGIDHLLFVLALLLLIRRPWVLLKTITAFTAAHSLTLAAVSTGWAEVSGAPVEALIALSIAFAAAEIPDRPGRREDLIRKAPWLAAFAFGLLHGFGFGGALKEIGLPQSDVPLALLTFNLGVEAGQVLFIAGVLALHGLARRVRPVRVPALRAATAYGIGSIAVFWFLERLASIP